MTTTADLFAGPIPRLSPNKDRNVAASRRRANYEKAKADLAAARRRSAHCAFHDEHDPSCPGCKANARKVAAQ